MLKLSNPALAVPDLILKIHPSIPINRFLSESKDDKALMVLNGIEYLHLPKSCKTRKEVYDVAQLFGAKSESGRVAIVETGEFYDLLISSQEVQGHDIIILDDDEIDCFLSSEVISIIIKEKKA